MFEFDKPEKMEALNFATLMNVLAMSEQKLEPLFEEFSEFVDVTLPMDKPGIINDYATFFAADEVVLLREYRDAYTKFKRLLETDEIIKRGSDDYPELLLNTEQAPRYLYARGNLALLKENRTVALVGSRNASGKAREETAILARKLGENGITVVSGLAKGIDVSAHIAALNAKFNTIAVIGTNLNQYYPSENEAVQKEIEKKGLVISQFSPATKTQRWFFPMRNGVMSGLSLATVIMEAGETSGALKQADYALKQDRLVLIAKQATELKSITWPRKYIARGAQVVDSVDDVLSKLAASHILLKEEELEKTQYENLIPSDWNQILEKLL